MTHRPECVPPDEVGARGYCCCCGPSHHDWQTGVNDPVRGVVLPDVCMSCGAERPHGGGALEIETTCEDCPPVGYPTDETRCSECPRLGERAMTIDVINPESAILQQLQGYWMKYLAMVIYKLAPNGVTLTIQ